MESPSFHRSGSEFVLDVSQDISIEACIRAVCAGPSTSDAEQLVATLGPVPLRSRLDAEAVSSLVSTLRDTSRDLEEECRSLWVDRCSKVGAEREAIACGADDIQHSVDAMVSSMSRLGSDVMQSLSALEDLGNAQKRIRETKGLVTESIEMLENLKVIEQTLASNPKGRAEDLYYAARVYSLCLKNSKLSLNAFNAQIEAMKPLLDREVDGLLHRFLEEADGSAASLGRDAMDSVELDSDRYCLEPLSYAMVVKREYDRGSVQELREAYINHREQQLGTLLSHLSIEDLAPLVGFFLIEIGASNIMDTREFLKTIWDGTSAAISAELGAALDESNDWNEMLELKRNALRACLPLASNETDTTVMQSSLTKRRLRFEKLIERHVLEGLESCDGDIDKINDVVHTCYDRIFGYIEGLLADAEVGQLCLSRTEQVLHEILAGALSDVIASRDENPSDVTNLLSFVEMTDCILVCLCQRRNGCCGGGNTAEFTLLQALVDESSQIIAEYLADKTFTDAANIRSVEGDESLEGTISSWSDSIVEQFEFHVQEMNEFAFRGKTAQNIIARYATGLKARLGTMKVAPLPKDATAISAVIGDYTDL
jgi:hypothetical protein